MGNNIKPINESTRDLVVKVEVMNVHKANFNDTYYLETLAIDLTSLNMNELTWFDPYLGKSQINDTEVAIYRWNDEEITILEKTNGEIIEHTHDIIMDCVLTEDVDKSVFLASHIRLSKSMPI